ncbi:POTRA domain-containing protein, partial [Candidatus Cyanaurora vandensis]
MRWTWVGLSVLLTMGWPVVAQTPPTELPSPVAEPVPPTNEAVPPATEPLPSLEPLPNAPAVPPDQPAPTAPSPAPTEQMEIKVLVAEVQVIQNKGAALTSDLEAQVYRAIKTRPGQTTTRTQLQQDIEAVFATGYFADVKATPEDTSLGVRVTFDVVPNPVLSKVIVPKDLQILNQDELDRIFADQRGKTLNYGQLQQGVKEVEEWYASQGYVLAKVTDVQSTPAGDVTLTITEGQIEDIQVKGNDRTRAYIVTREIGIKAGDIFNRERVQADIQRVFALNLFKDVSLELNPGEDNKKVIVALKVEEKNTGSLGA